MSTKDRKRTESLLLEAARDVFSQHGFEGSSTRMIANTAGVNQSLISRYFGGKRGLLLALIQKEAMNLSSIVTDYPAKPTLEEECEAYASSYFNYLMDNLMFIRIFILQSMTDPVFLAGFKNLNFSAVNQDIRKRIVRFLQEANRSDAESAADNIIGGAERVALGTVSFQHLMAGQDYDECLATVKNCVRDMLKQD